MSNLTEYAVMSISKGVSVTPHWQAGAISLDARLLPVLRLVAREGSLNRAVRALRLSYRHVWGLLGKMEGALGHRLVLMERGRGARLTPYAEQLLEADETAAALLDRELADRLLALNREAPAASHSARARPLVIHASHDMALAELRDMMEESRVSVPELHFRGSLDCLASLARSECDMAGFHLPEAAAGSAALVPYRPALRIRGLRLIRFVRRTQGLMVARGNPLQLSRLADLARPDVRFVNRQPESGTRLCFDRLLSGVRLRPEHVNGYHVEEFTHAAVAATVASGMADAGFGIEAAARRQKLDFVPLATENYYLAVRPATLEQTAAKALLESMAKREFVRRVEVLPGYATAGMGQIISVGEALRSAVES